MIKSFDGKIAEDIFHGTHSRFTRRLPLALHAKATRLLDQLNAVTKLETLTIPPSNHLEKLSGDYRGYYSIRINRQWRIVFQWVQGDIWAVNIVDYH